MSTHLPLRIARPLHRQCALQSNALRPFSVTAARARKSQLRDPAQTEAAAENQGGRAPAAVHEEALSDVRNLPEDLGLFPGTIILPPLSKLPSIYSRETLQFGWKYIKSRVKGWATIWQYRRTKSNKPKPTLNVLPFTQGRLKSIALAKYEHIYKAFAEGDQKTISMICLSGAAKEFRDRIAARPPGTTMKWTVSKAKKARVVSNRGNALDLPGYPETALRQVVVRIDSTQTLEVNSGSRQPSQSSPHKRPSLDWSPDGHHPPQDGKRAYVTSKNNTVSRRVTEYLVLQRRMLQGVEGDWKVWGFANESTPETVVEDENFERDLAAFQAKQAV